MQDLSHSELLAIAIEAALCLCGLFALWKLQFSAAARLSLSREKPAPLSPWNEAGVQELGVFLLFVICGGLGGSLLTGLVLDLYKLSEDTRTILSGAGFQFGLLGGVLAFVQALPAGRSFSRPRLPFLKQGALSFAIILPLVFAVGALWTTLFHLLDIDLKQQDLVDIFRNADSPVKVVLLGLLAIVVAPITEELIFRAGLFRFMRARTPTWVAYLVPALLFASLHMNLASFPQLVCLGLLFSAVYERTGNIAVSMLAHALFNLNTILLIVSGLDS